MVEGNITPVIQHASDEDPLKYYDARSPTSLIPHALKALNLSLGETSTPQGMAILRNSARMAMDVKDAPNQKKIIPFTHQNISWNEGIYSLDLSSQTNDKSARLFEVGFLSDPNGNVVIKKVQKHRLRQGYRVEADYMSEDLKQEKRRADQELRRIHQHLHVKPEIFGLASAIMILGPHAKSDTLMLPVPSRQPEVLRRTLGMHASTEPHMATTRETLRQELRKILPLVDFQGMLRTIGVLDSDIVTHGAYRHIPLTKVYDAIQRFFTNDTHIGRHNYWNTLKELKNAQ